MLLTRTPSSARHAATIASSRHAPSTSPLAARSLHMAACRSPRTLHIITWILFASISFFCCMLLAGKHVRKHLNQLCPNATPPAPFAIVMQNSRHARKSSNKMHQNWHGPQMLPSIWWQSPNTKSVATSIAERCRMPVAKVAATGHAACCQFDYISTKSSSAVQCEKFNGISFFIEGNQLD